MTQERKSPAATELPQNTNQSSSGKTTKPNHTKPIKEDKIVHLTLRKQRGGRKKAREYLRMFIGLEEAEARAEQERSLGQSISVIDPNIAPGDYHWKVFDDDILAVFYTNASENYRLQLALEFFLAGANSIRFLPPLTHLIMMGAPA